MSSSASKLHHCPHKCGCDYTSKRPCGVRRHTVTRHPARNQDCPSYDTPPAQRNTQVVTPDGAVKQLVQRVEHRNQPAVQRRQEQPTVQEPLTVPNPKLRKLMRPVPRTFRLDPSDEEPNPDDEGSDSNSEESDPPTSQPKPDRSGIVSRPPNPPVSRGYRPLPTPVLLFHRMPSPGPSSSKRASLPSQPTASAPTRPAAPANPMALSIQPSLLQSTPPITRPSLVKPTNKTKPENTSKAVSRPVGKSTPPSPSLVVEPEPSRDEAPERPLTKGSPPQSTHEPDIESLYASSSPEKTVTELVPIEPDSDLDFEAMERSLFSHRGPFQSQSIKKEPDVQSPVLSQIKRPLKRQRSHPSPDEFSQAPSQTPQVSKLPKRPRVDDPHPSGLTAVLNDRRKHPEFWDLDGTVVLQVDDVLFRVMRSALSKASPWFRRLFSEELGNLEIMAGCPVYMIEEDLSNLDFANLLRGMENGL